MRQGSPRGWLLLALGVVVGVALWLLLAPQALGGDVAYVAAAAGGEDDLVMLRAAGRYHVDDAIAFRTAGGIARGRISGFEGTGVLVEGAGEAQVVPRGAVVGREWLTVPRGALVTRALRAQRWLLLPALAGVATAAGLIAWRGRPRPLAGARRFASAHANARLVGRLSLYSPGSRQAVLLLVAILLAGASLPVLALARGTTYEATEDRSLHEVGTFNYGQRVEGGVYDGDHLGAPEPVFRRLTDRLLVQFDYAVAPTIEGQRLEAVTGSYRLRADVSQPNGWRRTIATEAPTLFAGPEMSTAETVQLRAVDSLVEAFAASTGVTPGATTLHIVAEVSVEGLLDGEHFSTVRTQALTFNVTELQVQFLPAVSELETSGAVAVPRLVERARQLGIPATGLGLSYGALWPAGLAAAVLAALGLAAIGAATRHVRGAGELALIHARHGHRLVEARSEVDPGPRPLDVRTFDDLARLADRDGLLIVHYEDPLSHEYFVFERDVTYRHRRWKDEDLARAISLEPSYEFGTPERRLMARRGSG